MKPRNTEERIPLRYCVFRLAKYSYFEENKTVTFEATVSASKHRREGRVASGPDEIQIPYYFIHQPSAEDCHRAAEKICQSSEARVRILANLGIPTDGNRLVIPEFTQEKEPQMMSEYENHKVEFNLKSIFKEIHEEYSQLMKSITDMKDDTTQYMDKLFTIPGCCYIVDQLNSAPSNKNKISSSISKCINILQGILQDLIEQTKNKMYVHRPHNDIKDDVVMGQGHISPFFFPFRPWICAFHTDPYNDIDKIPKSVSWETNSHSKSRITTLCILGKEDTHNKFDKGDTNDQWVVVKEVQRTRTRSKQKTRHSDGNKVTLWKQAEFVARVMSVVWLFAKVATESVLCGSRSVCSNGTPVCQAMSALKHSRGIEMSDVMCNEDLVYIWTVVVYNMQNKGDCSKSIEKTTDELFMWDVCNDSHAILHLNPSFLSTSTGESILTNIDRYGDELFKCYSDNGSCFKLIELKDLQAAYQLSDEKEKQITKKTICDWKWATFKSVSIPSKLRFPLVRIYPFTNDEDRSKYKVIETTADLEKSDGELIMYNNMHDFKLEVPFDIREIPIEYKTTMLIANPQTGSSSRVQSQVGTATELALNWGCRDDNEPFPMFRWAENNSPQKLKDTYEDLVFQSTKIVGKGKETQYNFGFLIVNGSVDMDEDTFKKGLRCITEIVNKRNETNAGHPVKCGNGRPASVPKTAKEDSDDPDSDSDSDADPFAAFFSSGSPASSQAGSDDDNAASGSDDDNAASGSDNNAASGSDDNAVSGSDNGAIDDTVCGEFEKITKNAIVYHNFHSKKSVKYKICKEALCVEHKSTQDEIRFPHGTVDGWDVCKVYNIIVPRSLRRHSVNDEGGRGSATYRHLMNAWYTTRKHFHDDSQKPEKYIAGVMTLQAYAKRSKFPWRRTVGATKVTKVRDTSKEYRKCNPEYMIKIPHTQSIFMTKRVGDEVIIDLSR